MNNFCNQTKIIEHAIAQYEYFLQLNKNIEQQNLLISING